MFTQSITPNPHIYCYPGWCLMYVRQTFGLNGVHPTATAAWYASPTRHEDFNFPEGVAVPVWFALDNEPAGHVALRMPDGSVFSTSDLGSTPHHHPNLADLLWYYAYYGMALTYLGWTEDIENVAVVANSGMAAQGTITAAPQEEEFELANGQYEEIIRLLNAVVGTSNRACEVAQATEDRGDSAKIALIFQMLSAIAPQFKYVKGPDDGTPESKTLYELEDGNLRPIGFTEWQAKGGGEPVTLSKEDIDKLLGKRA